MGALTAGLAFFSGLLMGVLFGWDVRSFLSKGIEKTYPYGKNANDIRPEDVPDVVPTDKEDRF